MTQGKIKWYLVYRCGNYVCVPGRKVHDVDTIIHSGSHTAVRTKQGELNREKTKSKKQARRIIRGVDGIAIYQPVQRAIAVVS